MSENTGRGQKDAIFWMDTRLKIYKFETSHMKTMSNSHIELQSRGGTYALVLASFFGKTITIGKLGKLTLIPGVYIYVGSACGSGGVKARVNHHCRPSLRHHWHIDYLKRWTRLIEVWCTYDDLSWEHQWATILMKSRRALIPMAGFGASDCNCETHLIYFRSEPSIQVFLRQIRSKLPPNDGVAVLRSNLLTVVDSRINLI